MVDTIFGFDRLVRADKQLRHLGRFVKDVFGVKAIVGDPDEARALHAALQRLAWSSSILDAHGVPMSDATARMEYIEVKDYMAGWGRKATGWEAIKSVFRWWDTMIEVQVQPLANFHREREALTRGKPRRIQGAPRGASESDCRPHAAVPLLSRPAPLAVPLTGRTRSDVRLGPYHPDRLRRVPCLRIPIGFAQTTMTSRCPRGTCPRRMLLKKKAPERPGPSETPSPQELPASAGRIAHSCL